MNPLNRAALIVEDDPHLCDAVVDLVQDFGVRVTTSRNGLDALSRLARADFDLTILDIDIEALCGLGVQRAVRDFTEVPTIVYSARNRPWQEEALRAGASACLRKPFRSESLSALIKPLLITPPPSTQDFVDDVRQLGDVDLEHLQGLSGAELDGLPFGAIRLDAEGKILTYNAYEAHAAGFPTRDVVGRSFFELAPCMAVSSSSVSRVL